ncbi:MAG: DUF5916 domain-containing protein [bacterium]
MKILFLFFSFILGLDSFAQDALKPFKTPTPPIIDGELNDTFWQNSLTISGFKTFAPDFGHDATEKTLAYAAYDSDNLYFAFYCYDREPEKIKTSVNNRDNITSDDWVCINLDTFNDQQSLYAFYINPFGIQSDSRYSAGQEDFSSDFVWYSAGKIQNNGYSVEIHIPLKSIRYSETNPVIMSIFFERYISRFSEHASFPEFDAEKGFAFFQQMQQLEYNELNYNTLLEVIPAFTYSRKYNLNQAGNLEKHQDHGELSLTAKYGITSDLILDATYNPDFSQIESDAGQVDVNLRYALYYPEKRSFFLEGNEIYNVAATTSSIVDPLSSLLHTRTIMDPLTGIKLSGKIGIKNTVAAMYAMDEQPDDLDDSLGNYSHFPILRYRRTLWDDSYIGAIYTGKELTKSFNRVGGIDGIFRLSESSLLEFNAILSRLKSTPDAESKNGHTWGMQYCNNTRDVQYEFSAKEISTDFNTETGYLTRNGILNFTGLLNPKFYPESSFFQRIELQAFTAQSQDKPSGMWETSNHVYAQVYFLGALAARIKYSYSTEIFTGNRYNTSGFDIHIGGLLSRLINLSVFYKIYNSINYLELYQGKSNLLNAIVILSPTENIESESSFIYNDFYRSSNSEHIYDYMIIREKLTYQLNKYLFFRGIVEYNDYWKTLLTDFLISFTYVPGTVIYLGYGSLYEKLHWNDHSHQTEEYSKYKESMRGFFCKLSYLWRL